MDLIQNILIERFVCFGSCCFHLASAVCFGVAALHLVGYLDTRKANDSQNPNVIIFPLRTVRIWPSPHEGQMISLKFLA